MGFAELFVIALVGLLVIGPDKLPQTIKTCLIWFGRIKRLVSETRSEFEQQLGVDEIRREIHNEEVMASLKALKVAKDDALGGVEGYAEKARKEISELEKYNDFDPDDEGLFGEQHANHPPVHEDEDHNTTTQAASSASSDHAAASSAPDATKTTDTTKKTKKTKPPESQGAQIANDPANKQ